MHEALWLAEEGRHHGDQPSMFPRPLPPAPEPSAIQADIHHASVCAEIQAELDRARTLHPTPQNSAHEGFAVLLEEVDELKAHVWAKQSKRDLAEMRKEAVQVAAMAARFVVEVCDGGRGRV